MVGDNKEIKNNELNGKSHLVEHETEFWENLGYDAEANTVRRNLHGSWRVTEARYVVETEVSAAKGADLQGADHFSCKIWGDVHRNQRSKFRDLSESLEKLYVETRFGLDVELA